MKLAIFSQENQFVADQHTRAEIIEKIGIRNLPARTIVLQKMIR